MVSLLRPLDISDHLLQVLNQFQSHSVVLLGNINLAILIIVMVSAKWVKIRIHKSHTYIVMGWNLLVYQNDV